MPLWKFSNLNKYGNLRHRIIHTDSSQFSYKPKGLGPFVGVRRFKYTYEHSIMPPSLFVGQDGKKFIVPTWQEVLPETTLADIEWIKPEKPVEKTERKEWKFESKSDPGHFYLVTQVSDYKVRCTCSGQWRAKDRKCRHMKEVMKELGI